MESPAMRTYQVDGGKMFITMSAINTPTMIAERHELPLIRRRSWPLPAWADRSDDSPRMSEFATLRAAIFLLRGFSSCGEVVEVSNGIGDAGEEGDAGEMPVDGEVGAGVEHQTR